MSDSDNPLQLAYKKACARLNETFVRGNMRLYVHRNVDKEGKETAIERVQIDDQTLQTLKDGLIDAFKSHFEPEATVDVSFSNDCACDEIYGIEQGDKFDRCRLAPIDLVNAPIFRIDKEHGTKLIKGFLFGTNVESSPAGNNESHKLALYQRVYNFSHMKKNGIISMLRGEGDQFDAVVRDMITVETNRVDYLLVDDYLFAHNANEIKSSEDYKNAQRDKAEAAYRTVSEKIGISESGLSFVRNLIKENAGYRSVLAQSDQSWIHDDPEAAKRSILDVIRQKEGPYASLRIDENGNIIVDSDKAARELADLIDDAYLGSDVSGYKYRSHKKTKA